MLTFAVCCGAWLAGAEPEPAADFLIGLARADITLPVLGVPMLGYVRPDQIAEGLHQRLYARAFVIAERTNRRRVAIVVCDLAFPTHTLKLAVLERLRAKLGDRYEFANLMLTATHTHAAPGGFHHHLSASGLGGPFFPQCFDALSDGIAEAVLAAEADLRPGRITFVQGELDGASANRSRVAYMLNPASERSRYSADVDTTMTVFTFVRDGEAIGLLNWFAVHPTSMHSTNRLISGDNKGRAADFVERTRRTASGTFVAAFAQSNCGDVTPNLNLDNSGPGRTDVDSTRIIGDRQARCALRLLDQPGELVRGTIDDRHRFVDFSRLAVAAEFTGQGERRTCPSAFGYSFAAGSFEDGGGHPLFREGETESRPGVAALVRATAPGLSPTPELERCQRPKPILLATGLPRPPAQEQVLPLGLVRIGQLVLVVAPAEFTTMAGRRIREAVARELAIDPRCVVIAGYANDYAGYVTTREEYDSQQYEGGHTLFGPWTECAYRQEFVRLAQEMKSGRPTPSAALPEDMRLRKMPTVALDGPDDLPPAGAKFGSVIADVAERYLPGDRVAVSFWTGSPVNDYRRTDRFLIVERLAPETGAWTAFRSDGDWDTTIRWRQPLTEAERSPGVASSWPGLRLAPVRRDPRPEPHQVTLTWQTEAATPSGTYRFVHFGRFKKDGTVTRFTAYSRPFQVHD